VLENTQLASKRARTPIESSKNYFAGIRAALGLSGKSAILSTT